MLSYNQRWRTYTKSAYYDALFIGATQFDSWNCKLFMWTVAHNQCLTTYRLAKRGLNHPPKFPLCGQDGETIDHLLVFCVFTRQFWFNILQLFGLQIIAPQVDDHYFIDWWAGASSRFSDQVKKEVNSIIILGSWLVWKRRNYYVFDGGSP